MVLPRLQGVARISEKEKEQIIYTYYATCMIHSLQVYFQMLIEIFLTYTIILIIILYKQGYMHNN